MLHIILLILKIAGIILAAILGILLLALCTVLFVPFCYRGRARWDAGQKDFRARGRITWLLGLVELRFAFRDGRASVRGRVAWKKLGLSQTGDRGEQPDVPGQRTKEEKQEENEEERTEEKQVVREESRERKKEEDHEKEREKDHQRAEETEKAPEAAPAPEKTAAKAARADKEEPAQSRLEKIRRRFQKIAQKIKCTFDRICAKINLITEKKEQIAAFLSDETHKKAFCIAKKECIRLLGSVLPRQFSLSVRFGFKDPYHTGQLLAGIAVLYPFLPGDVRVEPDFEERIFQGKTKLRGRLYTASLVFAALQLIRRRAVRETFRDIRGLLRAEA